MKVETTRRPLPACASGALSHQWRQVTGSRKAAERDHTTVTNFAQTLGIGDQPLHWWRHPGPLRG